jgi:hypothetical protein
VEEDRLAGSTGSETRKVGTSEVGVEISVVGEAMGEHRRLLYDQTPGANVSPVTVNPSRSKAALSFPIDRRIRVASDFNRMGGSFDSSSGIRSILV